MTAGWLVRRHGTPLADGALRVTALLGLVGIPLVHLVPRAAELVVFGLITIWLHGPASPLFPGTYEPTLLLFGQLYSPLVIALLGTLGCLWVEWLNYHLHRSILRQRALAPLRAAIERGRFVRLFRRWPFFAVWLCIVTPIPDWIVRILAPISGYSIRRYLLAGALANLIRFWLVAGIGQRWRPDPRSLWLVALVSLSIAVALLVVRLHRSRTRPAVAPLVASSVSPL
jgi:membrane protein DedA with SNARE-associated domain